MKPFRLSVPATSANLGPGFDCLGIALGLSLRLRCEAAPTFSLELAGEGASRLPRDATNLLVRALLAGAGSQALPGVRLRVESDIPLARGLGSSSAAIVAGLAAGHVIGGSSPAALDPQRILGQALPFEGHADNIAPAVLGDLVMSGVEDGEVIAVRSRWPEELKLVAVIPERTLATSLARKALPARVPHADAVLTVGRAVRLVAALANGRWELLKRALGDRLHQPYRLPLVSGLEGALARMTAHPACIGAYLSGAGTTLMGLALAEPELVGEAGVVALEETGCGAVARVLDIDRVGLRCEVG